MADQWPGQPVQDTPWPGKVVQSTENPDQTVQIKPVDVSSTLKDYASTSLSQLKEAPGGALKDIGSAIADDYHTGKYAAGKGIDEIEGGDRIKGIINLLMGGAQMATAPITGAIKKAPDYMDPGTVPEAGEAGAARLGGEADAGAVALNAPKPPAVPLSGEEAPKPAPVGAAPASTAEILQGTINDRLKNEAKAPGFVDGLKHAGKTFKAIFAPSTMDASGARARTLINKAGGRATRMAEQAAQSVRQFRQQTANMTLQEQLDFIDYVQSRSKRNEPIEEVKPLADALRSVFQGFRGKLEASRKTEEMGFQEDYFSQQWKDPERAKQFMQSFGSKEGSGGFTKARSIPSYAEGIRAGLEPVTTDPVEATLRYIENASKYIARNDSFDEAIDQGDVVWRTPGDQPQGWVELNGRIKSAGGNFFEKAYAPEGWARVYNNFTSRLPAGPTGDLIRAGQKVANTVTAFKLGLSGFHALMMAQESAVSGLANALGELRGGRPITAALSAAKVPLKPMISAVRGRQMQKAYLDGLGSPQMQRVVELATDANFRVAGKGRVADEYRFTDQGGYFKGWEKGARKAALVSGLKAVGKDLGGIAQSARNIEIRESLKKIANTTLRTLETVSDPLFKVYIPLIKNGAYYDGLNTWLKSHPEASAEEQLAYANELADSIDNRFGEMNQDRIFWSRTQKAIAQTILTSYSYTLGTGRLVGGAAVDTAKLAKSLGKSGWTDNMDYMIALPIVYGTLNAVYQYLHGQGAPKDMHDLIAPRTGGVDAASGLPERAQLPSYFTQIMEFADNPQQVMLNKQSPALQLGEQLVQGKDWRGDPIANSDDPTFTALKKYLELVGDAMMPISVEQSGKQLPGTAVGSTERFMGVRPAGMREANPEGYASMKKSQALDADALKAWHDHVADRRSKGAREVRGKEAFIRRYKKMHGAYQRATPYKGTQ